MRLAKDGIFPIVKDKDGHLLPDLPASGFQFAGTVQGEGKLCGIPSLFVRLAGCNLQCHWQGIKSLMSKVKVRLSIPFDFRNQCHLIRS